MSKLTDLDTLNISKVEFVTELLSDNKILFTDVLLGKAVQMDLPLFISFLENNLINYKKSILTINSLPADINQNFQINSAFIIGLISNYLDNTYIKNNLLNILGSFDFQNKELINLGEPTSDNSAVRLIDLSLLLDDKLDTTVFNTYTTSNDIAVNNKLDTTVFNTYTTSNDIAVNNKLDTTVFNTYTTSNDITVNNKLDTTVFNTYTTSNDTRVTNLENNKLDTTVFNTYTTSNDTRVTNLENNKLDTTIFNTYKTSNDTRVTNLENNKLNTTVFNNYKNNFSSSFVSVKRGSVSAGQLLSAVVVNSALTGTNLVTLLQQLLPLTPVTTTSGEWINKDDIPTTTGFPTLTNSSVAGNYLLPTIIGKNSYKALISLNVTGVFTNTTNFKSLDFELRSSDNTTFVRRVSSTNNIYSTTKNTFSIDFPVLNISSGSIFQSTGFNVQLYNNNANVTGLSAPSNFTIQTIEIRVNIT